MTNENHEREDRAAAEASNAAMLLADWLETGAFFYPDRLALVGDARRLSYGALFDRIERFATVLAEMGARPGTRIALLAHNGPMVVEAIFAAARIGAVIVPLNNRLVGAEIAYQIEDSGAEIALIDPAFAELAAQGGLTARPCLTLGADYDQRVAHAARFEGPRPAPDAVVLQLYTSGTTGRPKGCMLSQANWIAAATGFAGAYDVSRHDVIMTTLPLFHVAGLGWCMATLLSGGTLVLPTRFEAGRCWALAEELGLTIGAIPFNLREALEHPAAAAASRTLRMLVGQVPNPPPFLDKVEMTGGYGATEMCGQSLALRSRDGSPHGGLIGRLINGYAARIVDADGQQVATGEVGELLLRGPAITRGYWNMPEASAALLQDGWLHSGDLVRADADGLIYFVDRLKDMIKSGGENVYAAEVEAVLNAHADIVEVAVIGVPDERWGQAVKAVLVSHGNVESEALARALDAWCLERLAPYKRPRWFEFVARLPRNATAKVTKPPLVAAHDPATSIRLSER